VNSVRTVRVKGKRKTQLTRRGRFEGWTKTWKKAIVTLKEGDKIDYSVMLEPESVMRVWRFEN